MPKHDLISINRYQIQGDGVCNHILVLIFIQELLTAVRWIDKKLGGWEAGMLGGWEAMKLGS
jgi:hypothetical protein